MSPTISDSDRAVSRTQNLATLKLLTERSEAADYLKEYWNGWIAQPMLNPIAHGQWAQLSLACIALESLAYHWKCNADWRLLTWRGKSVWKSTSELFSGRAFATMFKEVFAGDSPPAPLSIEDLADLAYSIYRCGLAHRGLSVASPNSGYIGTIGAIPGVFSDAGTDGAGLKLLCVNPGLFAERVNVWMQTSIVDPLRSGGNPAVDTAFKEWCSDRWGVRPTQWNF